jgi:hypothetical protein
LYDHADVKSAIITNNLNPELAAVSAHWKWGVLDSEP